MSQFPPAPPMGVPPGAPMYSQPPQKRNNVAAILSLITGILFCIPVMGVLAVILGIVGIKKGNNPNVGGKGMAITGLILGVLGLIWTGVFLLGGAGFFAMMKAGAPSRAAAHAFAADVGAGNADAAIKDCSSTMDPDKVRATVAEAQAWGPLKDTTFFSVNVNNSNGSKTANLGGLATFANAKKTLTATMTNEGGAYKVSQYDFTDAAK